MASLAISFLFSSLLHDKKEKKIKKVKSLIVYVIDNQYMIFKIMLKHLLNKS